MLCEDGSENMKILIEMSNVFFKIFLDFIKSELSLREPMTYEISPIKTPIIEIFSSMKENKY